MNPSRFIVPEAVAPLDLAAAQRRFLDALKGITDAPYEGPYCLACAITEGVEMESSRTRYPHGPNGENPNADIPLCRKCAEDHHSYWDEEWDQYHRGQM
jgi:hypothetical protein